MSPEFSLSIIAIIISAVTVLFVIIDVGMKLGIGFREEGESTTARKARIDKALSDESDVELAKITDMIAQKKATKDDLKEEATSLVRIEYYRDFAKNLLEQMTSQSNSFIRGVIASLLGVSLTAALWVMTLQDITNVNLLLSLVSFSYTGMTLVFLYMTNTRIKKYYFLREAFVKLSEEPTCESCQEIDESLQEKGISF